MESHQPITPQETMQLSDLLTLKNLSLTKSVTMSPLISDEELKSILQNDAAACQQHIKDLRMLLERSYIAVSNKTES